MSGDFQGALDTWNNRLDDLIANRISFSLFERADVTPKISEQISVTSFNNMSLFMCNISASSRVGDFHFPLLATFSLPHLCKKITPVVENHNLACSLSLVGKGGSIIGSDVVFSSSLGSGSDDDSVEVVWPTGGSSLRTILLKGGGRGLG
jgi:hypothetical protein